jgi:hypothetical protein
MVINVTDKENPRSNVTIVGRLATFGDRIIMRARAKGIEKQFTQALQEKLKGGKF